MLVVREEVAAALGRGQPVVALESTLIAHGLPRPDNLSLAHELEGIVRAEGAVPATVGVVEGTPAIGLDDQQLERIATSPDVAKLSVRDLAVAMALHRDGATTVAATAWLAARAGVRLFATGGLGGVHRNARESWDESADLATLSCTPIAVVCAGVKSILDVGATLERLESLSVAVVGFRTRRFPGFYLSDSGYALDWSVETEEDVARMLVAQDELARSPSPPLPIPRMGSRRSLKGRGGATTAPLGALIVANPIPEAEQLDAGLHERALAEGLAEAARCGIRGKAITPFLLERFHRATGGESLRVNKQIVRNNARLAARISRVYAQQRRESRAGEVSPD